MDKRELIINTLFDTKESVSFILNAELAIELAESLYEYGVDFAHIHNLDGIYDMADENDILSLAKNVYGNGTEEYFLQEVLKENGDTLLDNSSEFVFIEEELLDIVDIEQFDGNVYELLNDEEIEDLEDECLGRCECCTGCGDEEGFNYEEHCDRTKTLGLEVGNALKSVFLKLIDGYLEDKLQELASILNEKSDGEDFCPYCLLKELLSEVYMDGVKSGQSSIKQQFEELINKI